MQYPRNTILRKKIQALFADHLQMFFDLVFVCTSVFVCLNAIFACLHVCQQWQFVRPVSLLNPSPSHFSAFKMEDLFIQRVCGSWFPGFFVRELVCLWQQAGGALGSSSPLVRLYPGRLSDTGLGGCHEAGWAWVK